MQYIINKLLEKDRQIVIFSDYIYKNRTELKLPFAIPVYNTVDDFNSFMQHQQESLLRFPVTIILDYFIIYNDSEQLLKNDYMKTLIYSSRNFHTNIIWFNQIHKIPASFRINFDYVIYRNTKINRININKSFPFQNINKFYTGNKNDYIILSMIMEEFNEYELIDFDEIHTSYNNDNKKYDIPNNDIIIKIEI
jgi:hypothetical protein